MKPELSEIITIRPWEPDDQNFVLATWLRGLYYGSPWFKEIQKDNFMRQYHRVLLKILTKETIQVPVAVLKDDPTIVLGYSVLEPYIKIVKKELQGYSKEAFIIHFVFVKKAWRESGIAKSLIPQTTDITTHLTVLGKKIKPKAMEFDPFRI